MNTEPSVLEDEGPAIAHRHRRRAGGKATGPARQTKTVTKRPVKLVIDTTAYESLMIHSLRRGESMSDIISGLINRHLTDWIIHAKPGPKGGGESA